MRDVCKPALLAVLFSASVSDIAAEQLLGRIGKTSGADWCAAWLDLNQTQDFSRGEKLCIHVSGASRVLVRLKPEGVPPGNPERIEGSVREVHDGIVEVVLSQDHPNVDQLSVHSCQEAWGIDVDPNVDTVILNGMERAAGTEGC